LIINMSDQVLLQDSLISFHQNSSYSSETIRVVSISQSYVVPNGVDTNKFVREDINYLQEYINSFNNQKLIAKEIIKEEIAIKPSLPKNSLSNLKILDD